ncbi:MAG: 23S rRNA (pseudouridine1915-N3)-methyltransferase [Flavobacteriales bacterium]|jgi:23S rRNA (pseudouridine1915-N3)-methyltransferase
MKVTFIVVGKTVKPYLQEAEAEYDKRLKHYIRFEEIVIPELKKVAKLSENEIKVKEGSLILSKVQNSDDVILLDEGGKLYSSEEFANRMDKFAVAGAKNIVFVVGGAYGFSDEMYLRAKQKISLSKMTFSHQMVRTIFKEQLYRAYTILKGEPYHHR